MRFNVNIVICILDVTWLCPFFRYFNGSRFSLIILHHINHNKEESNHILEVSWLAIHKQLGRILGESIVKMKHKADPVK